MLILMVFIAIIAGLIIGGYIKTKRYFIENYYEERNFKAVNSVKMRGLFGVKFPDIVLYDLERNKFSELIEDSPLYIEIAKSLFKVIEQGMKDVEEVEDYDITKIFSNMCDPKSENYKHYVHIMRCLTNVNFDALIISAGKYDFGMMNAKARFEVESHVDKIIVEVGSNILRKAFEMAE